MPKSREWTVGKSTEIGRANEYAWSTPSSLKFRTTVVLSLRPIPMTIEQDRVKGTATVSTAKDRRSYTLTCQTTTTLVHSIGALILMDTIISSLHPCYRPSRQQLGLLSPRSALSQTYQDTLKSPPATAMAAQRMSLRTRFVSAW